MRLRSEGNAAWIGLTVLAVIVLAVHMWQFGDYIADDAAITFAYAKNLATGHGLVLSPGTDPVEGYSNFGWLVVMLPFCFRGTDPTWPVKGFSFVLAGVTLALTNAAARRLFSASRITGHEWLRALAAVGLAASTPYAAWAGSGMENPLYALLLVLGLYCYSTESWLGCAAALVGLSLTRFEGLAVAAIFIVHRLGVVVLARRGPSRRELFAVMGFVLAYGVYAAWHWWYFRSFISNTYLAKAPALDPSGALSKLFDVRSSGWMYVRTSLLEKYRFFIAAPLVLLPLFVSGWPAGSLLAMLLAGLVGLTVLTGGDFYPAFRLGTVILPVAFLLLAEASRIAVSRIRLAPVALVAACVPLILVCEPSLGATRGFGDPISMRAMKKDRADRYVEFARDMGKSRLSILESDVGAVAYFTGFPIIDIGGLANLHVARFKYFSPFLLQYVFDEEKPGVIHLQSGWARNAGIPLDVISRDYMQLDAPNGVPYAEGFFLRKDLYFASLARKATNEGAASRASQVAKAAEALSEAAGSLAGASHDVTIAGFRRLNELCDEDETLCPDAPALSRRARALADTALSQLDFGNAFRLFAAAVFADPRDIVSLRRREDMRVASAEPAGMLRAGLVAELAGYFRHKLAAGLTPSRSDLLIAARGMHLGMRLDRSLVDRLARLDDAPGLAEARNLLRLQREPSGLDAPGEFQRFLQTAQGRAVTARIREVAEIQGYSAHETTDGRVEVVVYFRPLRAWTNHRLWVHAYPAGSQEYYDVGPAFPLLPDWRAGQLAWEVFRTPSTGPFTLYVGVATGDELGPAISLGSFGGTLAQ